MDLDFQILKKCGLDWHFRSILTAEFQVHNFGLDCGFFTTMTTSTCYKCNKSSIGNRRIMNYDSDPDSENPNPKSLLFNKGK